MPLGERVVSDWRDGDRAVLDSHHVGDCRRDQLEPGDSRGGCDTERAAEAGADGARIATASGPSALDDGAGGNGGDPRAADARVLSQAAKRGRDRGSERRPGAGFNRTTCVRRAALGRGTWAVSYTHLRAHETGRNLVCRL